MDNIFIVRHGAIDQSEGVGMDDLNRGMVRDRFECLSDNMLEIMGDRGITKVFSSTERSAAFSASIVCSKFQSNIVLCNDLVRDTTFDKVFKVIDQNSLVDNIVMITHLSVIGMVIDEFVGNDFGCPVPLPYVNKSESWYTRPCEGWQIDLKSQRISSIGAI